MSSIAVSYSNHHVIDRAEKLAHKLQLPLVDPENTDYEFLLFQTHDKIHLKHFQFGSITIDFLNQQTEYRRLHSSKKLELLAKACGLNKYKSLNIIDATAGLGRDAFVLACLGANVVMLERSPILATLLNDALEHFKKDILLAEQIKLGLVIDDAKHYLQNLEQKVDVIYLDPMYPPRKKSATVKKEMRILQALLGKDEDIDALFAIARLKAAKRVVIKRPKLAEPIAQQEPDWVLRGQSTRFDVYFCS